VFRRQPGNIPAFKTTTTKKKVEGPGEKVPREYPKRSGTGLMGKGGGEKKQLKKK